MVEAAGSNETMQPEVVKFDQKYYLTRIVFLRFLGFLYFVAFAVALQQNKALLGKDGLTPYRVSLRNTLVESKNSQTKAFLSAPSLLWFVSWDDDEHLLNLSRAGLLLSFVPMVAGCTNSIIQAALWVLYSSIVNVGGTWYSFGWESQLLEIGFWCITISPLLKLERFPSWSTPPICIWSMRWLLFRIMIGAGLIKIRGDSCWRDLTCMAYHYETQPNPNPLSYYLHKAPQAWHTIETAVNHVVELVAPLLLFCPRRLRIMGAVIQVAFQVVLILSGNLSFLNWLTILPAIMCFDDAFLLSCIKPFSWIWDTGSLRRRLRDLYANDARKRKSRGLPYYLGFRFQLHMILFFLLLGLSSKVVKNLASESQVMNYSFDKFKLVNTYGAFGSVSKERNEVIVEGTDDEWDDPNAVWFEYEFKCKPGRLDKQPCLISPFHYRLDWLMWFAGFGENINSSPWLVHLIYKLLRNSEEAIELLESSPFPVDESPPKAIRATLYKYKFANNGEDWWERTLVKEYCPPLTLENPSLSHYLSVHGWLEKKVADEKDTGRKSRRGLGKKQG